MSREKSPSQIAFDDLLKNLVTPIFKESGYKKSGPNFFKRNEASSIVVNFQSSSGSSWNEKLFYINVGLAFDEICIHRTLDILDRPKEADCTDRGVSVRVKEIYSQEPECYHLIVPEAQEVVKNQLNSIILVLVEALSSISDLKSFRSHEWFDLIEGVPGIKALMYYLIGEPEAASKDVDRIVERFAQNGREKLAKRSHWCERYNMVL